MTGARLILWDIDHTLIATRGVGREIFGDAFEQATRRPMERMAEVSGRTEPDIFQATLALHGTEPSDRLFARFAQALATGYAARVDVLRQRGHAVAVQPEWRGVCGRSSWSQPMPRRPRLPR